jgi:hypothetical protein
MRSQKKTLITAVCVGLLAAVAAQLSTPKVADSCKSFLDQMQQLVTNDNGFSGAVVAAVNESAMTQVLGDRYGALSDKECTAMLPEVSAGLEALPHTPWAAHMRQAGDESIAAIKQCREKRVSGELKTHADSAQCSNPQIAAAFQKAGYPYMDLVALFTAKRLEQAQKIDKAIFGGSEDEREFAKLALDIAELERARVTHSKGTR